MATIYESTVEDVLEIISDLRGENTTNTSARRIRAVSRAERSLAKRRLWKLFFLPSQTITSTGVADYEIGSATRLIRNKGVVSVYVGEETEDKRYEQVDPEKFIQLYAMDPAKQMFYVYYDPANSKFMIHISPTPDNAVTIYYSYYWIPSSKTATSDTVWSIDEDITASLALAEIYDSEDEPELAAEQRNIAEQALEDEIGIDISPAYGQNYAFGSLANQNGNRGIGTY